uniref:2-succinyl-5-enolpyruvyl-6-hydroxy-3-cyclohexene-1-carboxylate synthase n=1 Tax=Candidatus Kentrum sp. LPFa TaxID=2126335 RepID=A0A450X096_9GAMM|nr:MAG: 2-succinyl-5-enolpyruvyl-6-hydroxy-3-cyclohexene-1-carboxylate synthase [Candidatus Kentron sp. LPFa]VFK22706.1 MAG: 2-succinyl-5-enolpyruvyl-6-hydroxy-3-cyclohexene-1-carboxylate synthase [Candidatus Kentron sp. LPFa]
MTTEIDNQRWGRLIIEEFARCGIKQIVLSPGSRSTPLVLGMSEVGLAPVVHFDERAAGFFALGYAKATGKAALLICTSGSAVANYWPAVVEASQSHVPLLIVSADRPPELLDCQANQAIDQHALFGKYVRHEAQLPCPTIDIPDAFARASVDQCVAKAHGVGGNPGPAHLNCAFREPFTHGALDGMILSPPDNASDIAKPSMTPLTTYGAASLESGTDIVTDATIEAILQAVRGKNGVIVAGAMDARQDMTPLLDLAESVGWPVLPDVASGLRFMRHDHIINHLDQVLLGPAPDADCVLWFGGPVVSKRLGQWIATARTLARVSPAFGRQNPHHVGGLQIQAEPIGIAKALQGRLFSSYGQHLGHWQAMERTVVDCLDHIDVGDTLDEVTIPLGLARWHDRQATLYLGNSMPIRDMDMFASACDATCRVVVNRGASGIDGLLASAAGYAHGSGLPLTIMLGDLSTLHDLNSLALVAQSPVAIRVVVINNDGGGIFHFLPIAEQTPAFESLFATPHGLSFEHAAHLFGLRYHQPQTLDRFVDALGAGGSSLIEVRSNRAMNVERHQRLKKMVTESLG